MNEKNLFFDSQFEGALVTFIIVTLRVDDCFLEHLHFFLENVTREYEERDYEVLVLAGESDPDNILASLPRVRVLTGGYHPWDRLSEISQKTVVTPLVALLTADDIWSVDRSDLISFAAKGAKIGVGNNLGVRPIDARRMRVFQNWTHFSEYLDLVPNENRFRTYVAEAPVTVWGVYEANYLFSLVRLVKDLMVITRANDNWQIIEDCINIVNLMQRSTFLKRSACVRFFDADYGVKSPFKSSVACIKDLMNGTNYGMLCNAVTEFLRNHRGGCEEEFLIRSNEVGYWLVEHAKGYIASNSRKWRCWVDVDFYPFDVVPEGVVPNAGSVNKYDIAYQLSRFNRPVGMAPRYAWIREPVMVDLLYSIPEGLWRRHAVNLAKC